MKKKGSRAILSWIVCALFVSTASVCLGDPPPQVSPGDPPRFIISPSLRRIERPTPVDGDDNAAKPLVDPPALGVGAAGPMTRALNPDPNGWRKEEQARVWQLLDAKAPNVVLRSKARLANTYSFDPAGKLVIKQTDKRLDAFLRVPLGQRGDNNLDLAFELIASTPSGRKLLEQFYDKYQRGEVSIRPLDFRVRGEVEGLINGVCHTDFKTGHSIVSVDPYDTLGKLSAVLFHEMFHAVSDDQHRKRMAMVARWEEINKKAAVYQKQTGREKRVYADQWHLIPDDWFPHDQYIEIKGLRDRFHRDWEKLTFDIERETHDAHENFIAEVIKAFPEAEAFYQHLDTSRSLPRKTTDGQIIHNYDLGTLAVGIQLCQFLRKI